MRKRFEQAGGTIFEFTAAEAAHVHTNGVALQLPPKAPQTGSDGDGSGNGSGSGPTQPQDPITGRLFVDCMVSRSTMRCCVNTPTCSTVCLMTW